MGHIIDSTYIYGTFFAVIPYVKVTLMIPSSVLVWVQS